MHSRILLCLGLFALLAMVAIPSPRADEFTEEDLKKWQAAFDAVMVEGEKLDGDDDDEED